MAMRKKMCAHKLGSKIPKSPYCSKKCFVPALKEMGARYLIVRPLLSSAHVSVSSADLLLILLAINYQMLTMSLFWGLFLQSHLPLLRAE